MVLELPNCASALVIVRDKLGLSYLDWTPIAIYNCLLKELRDNVFREMWQERNTGVSGCLARKVRPICEIAGDRTFRQRDEMLLLGIAMAESESELNIMDTCGKKQPLLHLLITTHVHVEIIRLMVICGASTAQVDGRGDNAFHKAVMVGRDDYVMAMSANFTGEDRKKLCGTFTFVRRIPERESVMQSATSCMGSWNRDGNPPLYLLVGIVQDVSLLERLARALTSRDVNIDVKDKANGRSLLLFACLIEHVELVKICLDLGADISMTDNLLISPADVIATNNKFLAIREKLRVKCGAKEM